MKFSLIFIALFAVTVLAESMGLGPWGLSGWQGLPGSDVLSPGSLRLGASLEYTHTDSGTVLGVPLRGCRGFGEDFELAAEIPLVPVDNEWNGSFMGDISISGGWVYEKTRGGTALKLTGRLTLPTGEEYRDRGTELGFGGVTSTTFLAFRLSMAGEYAINGGRNPFNDDIEDVFYFSGGGSSFISGDLLLSGTLRGSTAGLFEAGASVQFILDEDLSADCGIILPLSGRENFGVKAGVFWTGEGF